METENKNNYNAPTENEKGEQMEYGDDSTMNNPGEMGAEGRAEPRRHLMRQFMQVGWLLNRFGEQRRSKFGPMGDPYRGQGRILALLKLQPGISQADLAYLRGMRPQSAGELRTKL